MKEPADKSTAACRACREGVDPQLDFTMAFQPIVHYSSRSIFGYEALVRGLNNEPAFSVLAQVNDSNRYQFDQMCRTKAISMAAALNLKGMLSINFLPNAVYQPERCIRTTLEAARACDFPLESIMFEFTEVEEVRDTQHLKGIVEYYRNLGFQTAIDDFGSGYAGLNLVAGFKTDIIKLDMELIRGIDQDSTRQIIVRNTLAMFNELGITTLAEGIETKAEMEYLHALGIDLMQGYYFARPGFETLPEVDFS